MRGDSDGTRTSTSSSPTTCPTSARPASSCGCAPASRATTSSPAGSRSAPPPRTSRASSTRRRSPRPRTPSPGEAQELATKLAGVKITITRPVGEGDRLYGSVTSRDVEEALAAQGFTVDRRRIEMEPLKALGTFPVTIRLATSVTATVEVTVAAKG